MSSRRRQEHDPFKTPGGEASSDLHKWDEATYGKVSAVDKGMQTALPVNIFAIRPDPRQPRRQIPSVVRQQWNGDPNQIGVLFDAWVDEFAHEVGREFDDMDAIILRVLDGEEIQPAEVYQEGIDAPRNWGVIGGALMAVVSLAAEIRRDGLTNPITIFGAGMDYQIETGERRWLAFHLLHSLTQEDWSKIPARAVEASSVWRQASENTARESLNAISMARQLALLLMDLYSEHEFVVFEEVVWPGGPDRAYYAQVADGNHWRVPRGRGEQLVSAMGIKNPVQLRQYRDLLRLPDEVWMLADDLNWEEGFIRTRIVEFSPIENIQIAKARLLAEEVGYRVIADGHTVTPVTVSDDSDDAAREELNGDSPPNQQYDDLDEAGDGPEYVTGEDLGDPVNGQENLDGSNESPDEDVPQADPGLDYTEIQVLEFAHDRAADNKPWFAVKDSPVNSPKRLNQMITKGLLRGSSAYTNTDYNAAHYAISAQGCNAIGRPFIATPQPQRTKPVSGAEFHAGNGEGAAGSPPKVDPEAEARKRDQAQRKALAQMAVMPDLLTSNMNHVRLSDIQTADGRAQGRQICQAAIEILQGVLALMADE